MPEQIAQLPQEMPLSAFLLTAWECTEVKDLAKFFPQSEQTCSSCSAPAPCYEMRDADFPHIRYFLCLTCLAHVLVAWCALVDGDEELFHQCEESLSERFLKGNEDNELRN